MNNNQLANWHRIAPGYYEWTEWGYRATVRVRGGSWHWAVRDTYGAAERLAGGSKATAEAAARAALEVLEKLTVVGGDKR